MPEARAIRLTRPYRFPHTKHRAVKLLLLSETSKLSCTCLSDGRLRANHRPGAIRSRWPGSRCGVEKGGEALSQNREAPEVTSAHLRMGTGPTPPDRFSWP